jgi:hypothetical protein
MTIRQFFGLALFCLFGGLVGIVSPVNTFYFWGIILTAHIGGALFYGDRSF